MLFPQSAPALERDVRSITLADGQTFKIVVTKPSYIQRFNDDGRHLFVVARSGTGDTWSEYQLGRVRDVVLDWEDMHGPNGAKIPFTVDRLLSLFGQFPEVVDQVMAIVNEAFRPLARTSLGANAGTPAASGEDNPATPPTPPASTPNSTEPPASDEPSAFPSVN
jgi:hypothetical protein